MKLLSENQGLLSVSKNQTSLKLLHLLYNAMREIDSHIWMLRESLERIDSVILVESETLI